MQESIKKKLETVFDSQVKENGKTLKVHTKEINKDEVYILALIANVSKDITLKRSGTGITVIVTI